MSLCVQSALLFCVLISLSAAQTVVRDHCEIDLVIALDGSGSIESSLQWPQVISFTREIINTLIINDTEVLRTFISIVQYGDNGKIFNNLTDNIDILDDALLRADQSKTNNEGTNTASALFLTTTLFNNIGTSAGGDRPGVPNVLILITDGKPSSTLDESVKAPDSASRDTNPDMMSIVTEVINLADTLKNNGTIIITVGIGAKVDQQLLQEVATPSTGRNNSISIADFDALMGSLTDIIETTCAITEIATTTTPSPDQQIPCRSNADIYFIIDASGSIGEDNYRNITQFVAGLILHLPIGSGTRVGNALFSNTEMNTMYLNTCNTSTCASDQVLATQSMRLRTNIADAIKMVREVGFTAANGDQPDEKNIIVIFTDGNSNINDVQTIPEALLAKKAGIHIIVIGITNWVDTYALQAMASDPYSVNYIQIGRAAELNVGTSYRDTLKALLCNDVDECNPSPCQCNTGAQCVDKLGAYTCECTDNCAGHDCQQSCVKTVDVVFALDASTNLQAKDHRVELDFVLELIRGVSPNAGDRVGFITYATEATALFPLSEYTKLDGILNGLTVGFSGGSTHTHLAINATRQMFADSVSEGADKVLVIITDGHTPDYTATWAEAKAAHDEGIDIVVVGINNMLRLQELQAMASGMGNANLFIVPSVHNLTSIVQRTRDAICNNIGECENVICQNGATPLERRGYCECQCPVPSSSSPGYSGPLCERAGSGKKDIVFLIDSSGSMRRERFRAILAFISELVIAYPTSQARFGAIYFSDAATMAFKLNDYSADEDVIAAIKNIPYMAGKTNTFEALNMITQERMFSTQNGGRDDAPNIIYVITDGQSTLNVDKTVPQAIATRATEGEIVLLGIAAMTLEARGIASDPHSDMLLYAPSFNTIINDLNTRQSLLNSLIMAPNNAEDYCDTSPCAEGATCENRLHRYVCVCPLRRAGLNCDQECNAQLDLAIVLDLTGTEPSTLEAIAFTKEVVSGLSVPTDVRVSVVTVVKGQVIINSFFNNHISSKMEVLNSLSFGDRGGKVVLTDALNTLGTEVYSAANGDRLSIPNALLLLVGNIPNDQFAAANTAAQAAKDAGVTVFAVGYGGYERVDVQALASSADTTRTAYIDQSSSVSQAAQQIINNMCQL